VWIELHEKLHAVDPAPPTRLLTAHVARDAPKPMALVISAGLLSRLLPSATTSPPIVATANPIEAPSIALGPNVFGWKTPSATAPTAALARSTSTAVPTSFEVGFLDLRRMRGRTRARARLMMWVGYLYLRWGARGGFAGLSGLGSGRLAWCSLAWLNKLVPPVVIPLERACVPVILSGRAIALVCAPRSVSWLHLLRLLSRRAQLPAPIVNTLRDVSAAEGARRVVRHMRIVLATQ
jgi:hypothetical protein